jgi:hypothetical protein
MIDVQLGRIPLDIEVTVNFIAPEIHNDGVFYTDSNGFAMQKRVLKSSNVAQNYYPVTTSIAIRDENTGL